MLVVVPTVSYFNTGYFIAFYTLMYYIIYTLIYNVGFADAKAQAQAPQEQDASVPDPSFVSDPVLQAQKNQYGLQEELDDEQAQTDENLDNHYTPTPYNHPLWPSPRPMNFVRAIIKTEPDFKVYGSRLTHEKAVDILAQRAYMSRKEFLRINPLSYSERYMRGINALYLLKDSIHMLEDTLRNETYIQHLRRFENERSVYPRY
jgi:hypothetical protein